MHEGVQYMYIVEQSNIEDIRPKADGKAIEYSQVMNSSTNTHL